MRRVPAPESPAARFADACAAERLDFQWDPEHGRAVFPPRLVSPFGGAELEWRTSAGLGTVYSTTTVHARGEPPRNVALVDLDEGFRMLSRVEAAGVRNGLRVQVAFNEGTPVFLPCPGESA